MKRAEIIKYVKLSTFTELGTKLFAFWGLKYFNSIPLLQ